MSYIIDVVILFYLCFILASSTLKSLISQVGYGNETTKVADMDSVRVRSFKQSLS